MALFDIHPGRRLSGALLSLLDIHPAALLGGLHDRRDARRLDDMTARLPPHLLDDVGMDADGRPKPEDGLAHVNSLTAALRS